MNIHRSIFSEFEPNFRYNRHWNAYYICLRRARVWHLSGMTGAVLEFGQSGQSSLLSSVLFAFWLILSDYLSPHGQTTWQMAVLVPSDAKCPHHLGEITLLERFFQPESHDLIFTNTEIDVGQQGGVL